MSVVPPPLPPVTVAEGAPRVPATDDAQQALVAHLKQQVLPALFAQEVDIGRYGPPAPASHHAAEPAGHDGGASALAQLLALMLQRLQEDTPAALGARASWWQRLSGADIEQRVVSEARFGNIASIAAQIEARSSTVREGVLQLDQLREAQARYIQQLEAHLAAGKAFAAELPVDAMALTDSPRERLLRRLTNLAALLASTEMSQLQLQLARGNALALLDRCSEVVQVLLPMWQQSRRALFATRSTDPALIAAAQQAHQRLLQSLQHVLSATVVPVSPTASEPA